MYWTDTVPQWAWIIIFWALFISLSMLGVLAYGEVEFWLSLIKVISITVFFILAIAISSGGIGPQKIGFKYWNDPGAFADSINGVARTFVIAGTLYAGTEMVGITAGESANPRRAVPRAINQVFWRILIFYVGMMFFIGILIPYTDERLLGKHSKTAASPLTIALKDANIAPAAHLINALIVISVISAGNSSLYVASRTITHLARSGMAPKLLGKTDNRGVPWAALLFTNIFACISFLSQSSSAGVLYEALITLSGVATFIVWAVIELVHIRFRTALKVQGQDPNDLPFKALWYPYGTYACLAANIFLIFFQGEPILPLQVMTNHTLNVHRLHCIFESIQCQGFRHQLHPHSGVCPAVRWLEVLAQDQDRSPRGNGYLDRSERGHLQEQLRRYRKEVDPAPHQKHCGRIVCRGSIACRYVKVFEQVIICRFAPCRLPM
jgi:yeast amino acid transporter